jgi:hypothetical protein
VSYAEACGKGARRVFLVHGELQAQQSLRQELQKRGLRVEIPERRETVDLS